MEAAAKKDKLYGELSVIALQSFEETAQKIDRHLIRRHVNHVEFDHGDGPVPASYLLKARQERFSNGEGKVVLTESVRGKDVYILCDVGNYGCTYPMHGFENHMGPDEHFQDLKRTLSAIGGKARRMTVVMPLLYASRQDKRRSRESLDCAMALQELQSMGVKNILTFDVHNSAVQNAIPLVSFENMYANYNIIKALSIDEPKLFKNKEELLVISPDTGGTERAIYYATIMKAQVGIFYKRRDYSRVVNGKNPILDHEYMGEDVEGRNVLIVDDIIASGGSIMDLVFELKRRKVNKIYVAATFALLTEGIIEFQRCYEEGLISRVYSTNLTYIPKYTQDAPWFRQVDMSGFIAKLIDTLNHSRSVAPLLDTTARMGRLF